MENNPLNAAKTEVGKVQLEVVCYYLTHEIL